MGLQALWDGVIAGYGIAVPVGAIAVLIIDTSIRRGLSSGLQAGAGAATADLIYATIAALSGSLLQPLLTPLSDTFAVLGGGALMAMAIRGYLQLRLRGKRQVDATIDRKSDRRTYFTFLGLTLLNPLTIIYFSALILGDLETQRTTTESVLFVLGAGVASLSWQWLLAVFGTFAGRNLPPRAGQILSTVGNSVVLLLGVRLLFKPFL